MKKFFSLAAALVIACFSLAAQNDKADNIIGKYTAGTGSDAYKVNFFKAVDGTYTAQIYWLANPYDKEGKVSYDTKNPDKNLRNTPSDRIVLIKGLGFSLVEVISSCPTNWGMTPQKALQWMEEKMIPYYPLGVYREVE